LLQQCQSNWEADDRRSKLDDALKYNQMIWNIFQSELSKPENPLPKKLREDILSLSIFIDKRIIDIMSYPDRDKLNIIININLNIAAGLRESSTKRP